MSAWKLPFTIVLMVSSVTVYNTFAGRIPKEVCKQVFCSLTSYFVSQESSKGQDMSFRGN